MSSEQKTWYQRVLKITTVPLSISITFPQITDNLELKMRTHICCIFYLPWYVCFWQITKIHNKVEDPGWLFEECRLLDLCTRSRSPPSVGLQGGFSDQPVTPLLPREGSACFSWGSRAPKPIYLSFPKSRMGWKEAWPWIPCWFLQTWPPRFHTFA